MKTVNDGDWILHWSVRDERHPKIVILGDGCPEKMKISGSPTDVLALFDGYLFETHKLQRDLNLPSVSSGSDIVRAAYQRWDTDFLLSLRGNFVFALWDEKRKRLIVARDAIGLRPCFYFWDKRSFIMSTSLDAILAQPEVSLEFNRPVVAEHLLGMLTSHQRCETFYKEVFRLPPANWLSIEKNQLDVSRYWDPLPPGFEWASDEEVAEFQPLLERAVGRCLSVGADSLALSGGFDSVGIAVLAADQLKGKTPPYALSLRFTNPVCDEGLTQIEVARALGMPQLILTLEESLGGRSALAASLDLSGTSPSPVVSIWQAFYTGLFGSAQPGLKHLLMGTGGDDLLTVDLRYGGDCLATLKLGKLWRFLRNCQRTSPFSAARVARVVLWDSAIRPEARALALRTLERLSPAGKAWLRARFGKFPWSLIADDELAATLEERRMSAPRLELAPGERSYVAAIRDLMQSPLLMHELEQGFAWAQGLGFSLLYPYFDQDLVGVLLRAHPEYLLAGGKAKAPLRRLVAARLPTVNLPSKKVDFGQMFDDMFRPRCEAQWQEMGSQKALADLGISDADRLHWVIGDYANGRSQKSHLVWRIISTETWLRRRIERGTFSKGPLSVVKFGEDSYV